MKICGGVITEVLNMWMMGYAETEDDVVKDFVAFGIISTIDDVIVMVIKNLDVEKAVEGETFKYSTVDWEEFEGNYGDKIWLLIQKFFRMVYVAFYFYFFPLAILVLVFIYGDGNIN